MVGVLCIHVECLENSSSIEFVHPYYHDSNRLFFLLLLWALYLGCSTEFLGSVLSLLALLPASLFNLGLHSVTNKSVTWFKSLHGLSRVIDETKAGAFATTELGTESENGDMVLVGLVCLTELITELILGDVCAIWMKDINNKLLPLEERIPLEFAGAEGNLGLSHDCGRCGLLTI